MQTRTTTAGTTNVSTVIRILDSTTGLPELAVEHDTSGIDLWYRREGAVVVSITEAALAALTTAHADGGIEHMQSGYYRLDLPDAACAASATGVQIGGDITGMVVIGPYHELVAFDPQDAVRMGMSALPAAAPDAAGGLPVSDAGGLDLDTKLAATNEITAARMGYVENLDIGENVAGTSEVTSIQNNTKAVRVVPSVFERPDAASTVYRLELFLYDSDGNMEAPDAAPTIGVVNEAGASRDANLDATTMSLVSTGRYRSTYTIAAAHALEQLTTVFSVVEGGATRLYGNGSLVVDTTAVDFTAADRAKLDTLHDTRLTAARATSLDELGSANIPADVDTLLTRLTAGRATNLDNLDAAVSTRSTLTAANVWAYVLEGSLQALHVMRIILAAIGGKSSEHAAGTPKYRDQADTKDRISATTDGDGNRTATTLDGT